MSDQHAADEQKPKSARKPYAAPELKEYGTIATLTKTGGLTVRDGPGTRKTQV